jgi:endonuclease/exonuclease/phosphatase family metal-dependent hydrolase
MNLHFELRMTDSHWRTIRVATYNIHRCRGLDGRTNPARIAEVIRSIDADVVALQEVIGAGHTSAGHAEELGALLGMGWVMAPARHLRGALFGNVVMSRLPMQHHSQYDLSWRTCEPRCCQRVDIAIGDDTLHLYNVHLGTALLERRHQAGRLSAILHDRRVGTRRSCSATSMNGCAAWRRTCWTERLKSIDLRAHLRRRRTYPGVFPVLHLDHIYYEGECRSREGRVTADPAVADGLGSPAAHCRAAS